MAKTSKAVAILAPDKIAKIASIKAKIVEPEKPGKILLGNQLKIKKPPETPATIKLSLAIFN